ncbi:twin-arginine translocase subunit TatC [Halomarina rubra]|uniref:Sec-independent protein translocase protein TatC n=1 Tax=Halomarina rubra TaxID=2071873 RepID=A0ABD6ATG5_9EURY|nr:twin-arginine translocase subunit TatC [Halomarina rubra]
MSGDERRGSDDPPEASDEVAGDDADVADSEVDQRETSEDRAVTDENREDSEADQRETSEEGETDRPDVPADAALADLSYKELQSLATTHGIAPVGHSAADLRDHIAEARDDSEGDDGSTDGTAADAETATDAEDNADDADDPMADHDVEYPSPPSTDWSADDEPAIDEVFEDDDEPVDDGDGEDPADRLSPVPSDEPSTPPATDAADDDGVAQSDGGATVVDGADTDLDYSYYEDDGDFMSGPEHDQEMPLADHIEEMVKRLGVVIIAMALVSVLTLPFAVDLINFIWYSILGSVQNSVTSPRAYQPLSLVLARLKVATLAGFVIALPVFVYETYLFMRPGLYKHERRYYLAAVPTSLILAFIGVAFAFYLVLPFIFSYFVGYSEQAADIAFGLTETFGLMLLLMGFFAAVFQIPLLIMLAVMMGLTTREWLAQRRLYFWGGFLGVALLFSPDPTGLAPFIVAITMVTLFEGTLLLLRWTQR